jgi:hypothetical protein
MLYCRWHHLLASIPSLWQSKYLYGRVDLHVLLPCDHWRPWFCQRHRCSNGHWNSISYFNAMQYDHHWSCLLSIVAETPSGRLRYKTIVIGRFVYNLTEIFSNSLTPRMISSTCKCSYFIHVNIANIRTTLICNLSAWNWGAKTGFFYAGTNLLCNIWCWFRLPETKDRTFGEIDLLFDNNIPARKFKSTHVNRKSLMEF